MEKLGMIINNFINYQDKLYWVYRRLREKPGKEHLINDIKNYWMCDLVIRQKNEDDPFLLFLREIQDAEVLS